MKDKWSKDDRAAYARYVEELESEPLPVEGVDIEEEISADQAGQSVIISLRSFRMLTNANAGFARDNARLRQTAQNWIDQARAADRARRWWQFGFWIAAGAGLAGVVIVAMARTIARAL